MRRRTSVDIPDDVVAALGETASAITPVCVVGVDVGAMTGVAIVIVSPTGERWRWSAQAPPAEAITALAVGLGGRRINLVVREAPFTVSRAAIIEGKTKMTPQSMFSMGESSGYMRRALEPYQVADSPTWRPMAPTWRSILGLNGGKRDDVNARVHQWAEATTGYQIRHGGKNMPALDEANAVGMAEAGASVAASILFAPRR